MKSIEERAKQLAVIDDDGWCVYDPNIYDACVKIAAEQRKIDVDKACEWLRRHTEEGINEYGRWLQTDKAESKDNFIERFIQAMEESV